MSERDEMLYVEDILDSVDAIHSFISGIDYETFRNDRKTYSATIREYIIIGEAISQLMDRLEEDFPNYPWRMVKDFRNFIVHEYFGVDAQIVWDLTTLELSELTTHIKTLKSNLKQS